MLRRFLRGEGGNMAMLMAAGIALSAVVAAFAVDAAALNHERRILQSAVDLAAIAAARDPANALEIARLTLVEAGVIGAALDVAVLSDPESPERLAAVAGHYRPDPALPPAQRFVPGGPANAVRVTAEKPGRLYFAGAWSPMPVLGASATASATPRVAFSLGSRLARLEGGVANMLLNRLLGTSVSLSALDYNGIANARVSLFGFLDALAQELGLAAGTYDDVLRAEASHGAVARALAATLDGGEAAAAGLIAAALTDGGGRLSVGRLIDLGDMAGLTVGSGGQNLFARVSALDLLAASATLADGARQAALGVNAGVPGLAGIAVDLAIGERPQHSGWFAVGPQGTVVRTAQVRLRVTATLLGGVALLGAQVRLPLYVEVAPAEAMAVSASCPGPGTPYGSAVIAARPGVARLSIGEVSDAGLRGFPGRPSIAPAQIVNVLLLKITGSAHAEIAQIAPVELSFSSAEIAAGTTKTARTTTPVGSLVASLIGGLDLDIVILGLGLGTKGAVTAALNALLAPLAPVLDALLGQLFDALGLGIGEADVRVYGVTCSHPVLVG